MSVISNVTIDTAWIPTLWPGVALVTGAGSGKHSTIPSLEEFTAKIKAIIKVLEPLLRKPLLKQDVVL